MLGTTIGNYVVRKKIGQGGMGAVYLAEHPRIGRQVAIKVLLPEVSKKAEVVRRFFTEARSSSEIHNEHIIDILDFGELADGTSYLIMEWLDGESLRDVIRREGKLPIPRALHITRGVSVALAAAHARGIVHRDLKPDNVFLIKKESDPDFVKVLDFGIAKLMQSESGDHEIKTQTGALIGTPSYMSPEQCRGQPVDQRTDIYALGVLMYQMFTGRLPFTAEGLGELLLAHMTLQPPAPHELAPELPEAIEAVILKALEKDLDRRYQHIEELLADLGGQGSQPYLLPTPQGRVGPYDRTLSRGPGSDTVGGAHGEALPTTMSQKRMPWALVGGGVVVAAAGVAALVMLQHKPEPPPPKEKEVIVQPKPQPPKTDDAPKTLPPPQAPEAAALTIKTTPANAQLSIDDARVPNPFSGRFPRGDVRHRLVVKAAGYRTEAEWIIFDDNKAIDVTLQKGSGTHERSNTKPAETKTETKPTTGPDGKPIYKGTKGKLITEFPE
jgi:eukaryotic-like serine/threonine-protein kinase